MISVDAKIVAANGQNTDLFGYSLSVSNDGSNIVVSAKMDDHIWSNDGSVYIYE